MQYFWGSVVGKASTTDREILPTPPIIFTGGQKVRNLASFKTSLSFEPTAFENAARYPNSETKSLSIIQPGIARFHSNFVQTLIMWHLMYYVLSRSTGQRSRSQRDITYQHKNAIIQTWISCRWSNLVKIIPEPRATCNAMFNVIRSNTVIAITLSQIARMRSNLVQSFITSLLMFKVRGQSHRVRGQGQSIK